MFYFKVFFYIALVCPTLMLGITLNTLIEESVKTNPDVIERVRFLRAVEQDVKIAKAAYYPSLDLTAAIGPEKTKSSSTSFQEKSLTHKEVSLTLTQNLFNGYATVNEVDKQNQRLSSAVYSLQEEVNKNILELAEVYIGVLKERKVLKHSATNLKNHQETYNLIKELFDSGAGSKSDMEQAAVKLSLANSNYIIQKNAYYDELTKLHRIVGRFIDDKSFEEPDIYLNLPANLNEVTVLAVQNNPSIRVSQYNLEATKRDHALSKKSFYPTLDLEVSQSVREDISGTAGENNVFSAMLKLEYNLFNGGADKATIQKNISNVNQDNEILRATKRQVIESIRFSWTAYTMLQEQLKFLRENTLLNEKTVGSYQEEFSLGRRELLDVLNAQSDLFDANRELVRAEYDFLFTKFRILEGTGEIGSVFGVSLDNQSKIVFNTNNKQEDILPLNPERDKDRVLDYVDICDNSMLKEGVNEYGCIFTKDLEFKEIKEVKQKPQEEPIVEYKEQKPVEITQEEIGNIKEDNFVLRTLNFESNSVELTPESKLALEIIARQLQNRKNIKIEIIAHTDASGSAAYNDVLSIARATAVKIYLSEKGLDESTISAVGRGEAEPIATNETKEGRALNRRIEFKITKLR